MAIRTTTAAAIPQKIGFCDSGLPPESGSATVISPDDDDGGEGGAIVPGSAVDDVLTCSDGTSSWLASCDRFTEVCRGRRASVDVASGGGGAFSGGYHFPSPPSHQPSPRDVSLIAPHFATPVLQSPALDHQGRKSACGWLLTTVSRVPQIVPRTRRHVTVLETSMRRPTGVNGVAVVLDRWWEVSRNSELFSSGSCS